MLNRIESNYYIVKILALYFSLSMPFLNCDEAYPEDIYELTILLQDLIDDLDEQFKLLDEELADIRRVYRGWQHESSRNLEEHDSCELFDNLCNEMKQHILLMRKSHSFKETWEIEKALLAIEIYRYKASQRDPIARRGDKAFQATFGSTFSLKHFEKAIKHKNIDILRSLIAEDIVRGSDIRFTKSHTPHDTIKTLLMQQAVETNFQHAGLLLLVAGDPSGK